MAKLEKQQSPTSHPLLPSPKANGTRLTTNQGRQACRSNRRSSSTEPPTPTSSTRPASAMPKPRGWANRAAQSRGSKATG